MARQRINEDSLFAPIGELGRRLRAREISAIALTEAYLDRLEKFGRKLGAVVTVARDLAMKEAHAADREIRAGHHRGPLHGIPYGVKDLVATRGMPTTWGAEPYRKQVLDFDGTIVEKLRAAGAILVAKLAMVELAGGFGYNHADASFTGPGRNPWNPCYWSGGSSTGPGIAVAAGLVAFAIGSETSGSIITPAAYCGVSGLRPTYGRVSRHGAMALSWTLDKLGPLSRSVEDCGTVLSAIAGRDPKDASSTGRSFTYPEPAIKRKFRIGIIKDALQGCQPEVCKNFEQSMQVFRKFCDIVEGVAYPGMPFGSVVSLIIQAEAASAFRDLLESGRAGQLRAANDRWGGYPGAAILAVDYLHAMRVRTKMKNALDSLHSRFDALVAPSRNTVATPLDRDFDRAYPGFSGGPPIIPAGNIAGLPAISIPNGFGPNNLPTGIQLIGRAWSESRLLAIARAYQQATDWHRRRPPLK
jgi:Asp-tRNA(Asn)/Glu-tRNA(Gln) amidotransferase A subunit family amidase